MEGVARKGAVQPNLTLLAGIQECGGYFFFDRDGAETLLLMKRNLRTARSQVRP
jgi:hypothetical protein